MTQKPKGPDPTMNNQEASSRRSGGLDRQVQAKIGQQLRAMYDDVVEQGVPDRFAELLKKLDSGAESAGNLKSDDEEPRP
jgi:hypothetical protein